MLVCAPPSNYQLTRGLTLGVSLRLDKHFRIVRAPAVGDDATINTGFDARGFVTQDGGEVTDHFLDRHAGAAKDGVDVTGEGVRGTERDLHFVVPSLAFCQNVDYEYREAGYVSLTVSNHARSLNVANASDRRLT